VHLLADVFENFRNLCLEYYELDPCHFYTGPGLAWQAALKMTGVELGENLWKQLKSTVKLMHVHI
jgi:hypothetical protein